MKRITKKEIDTVVGRIVKEYRLKKNLTQDELAKELDITPKYISRVENGVSGLGDETLIKYINFFGITPNTLYQDLITNKDIKNQMEISKKISELSKDKLDLLMDFIDLLNKTN